MTTLTKAVRDWYDHVAASGDLTDALLIARDNDTVAELNERARSHLAASRRLHGPTFEAGNRVFQAGDRILCRKNQRGLDVLNDDLDTIIAVDPDQGTITVQFDRDPETRELPGWYLHQGYVDYGYALTGHKAQGVTTGRTFTVMTGATDREWAYVAMSRGRHSNTLYLADPEPGDEQCTHLTHPDRSDALDALTASLGRSSAQTVAIDQYVGSAPLGSELLESVGRRRYLTEGLDGLEDQSRRPTTSPAQIPAEAEIRICEMRRDHPRWGARRIRAELAREGLDPPNVQD